jgi:1,4-alpha-glucan branching enzyme
MLSQANINFNTPAGATLIPGGATFRIFAPNATEVYLNGTFNGMVYDQANAATLLKKTANYWTGFMAGASDGDRYRFWVQGPPGGTTGYKRDPYSRELLNAGGTDDFPNCFSVIRDSDKYPWHDVGFKTPDFSEMVIYQAHVGAYNIQTPGTPSNFLDVALKVPYLAALNINVLQPLPIDEQEINPGMGYGGADIFSPDFPFIAPAASLPKYVSALNDILKAAHKANNLTANDISTAPGQLKALIDFCHVYGIAVTFDIVRGHAGGFTNDDHGIYFLDREPNGNNDHSLYCTSAGTAGGLAFAMWNKDICNYLLDNARYYMDELHADGFRYDEISVLLSLNRETGWAFCRNLSTMLRNGWNRCLQNAEFWPGSQSYIPDGFAPMYQAAAQGGCGFDVVQHDHLRLAIRGAVGSASYGMQSFVDMKAIAGVMYPPGLDHGWRAVTCVEMHDIVKVGSDQRIPWLACPNLTRTWYATSRSRFATALLLTAPGIPQLFMGQEFLQDRQWTWDPNGDGYNQLYWAGLDPAAGDPAMKNHLRFTQDALLMRKTYPALRSDQINVFWSCNRDRVLAFHRWIDGVGGDVVVAGTLSDTTWWSYEIGFPSGGFWREVFNSDVYENFVNPAVAGNGGGVQVSGPPMHGFTTSTSVVIPANGIVVFVKA